MAFEYPTLNDALPAIQGLIKLVSTGALISHKAEAAKDACCLLSYGSSQMFGEPGAGGQFFGASAHSEVPTDDEACNMLQAAANAIESGDEAGHKMMSFNWAALVTWLVVKILPIIFTA